MEEQYGGSGAWGAAAVSCVHSRANTVHCGFIRHGCNCSCHCTRGNVGSRSSILPVLPGPQHAVRQQPGNDWLRSRSVLYDTIVTTIIPFLPPIQHINGSHEQKLRYLPAACDGTAICAMAMTEPACGTDVLAMRTRAEEQSDGERLSSTPSSWLKPS